jgi:hypothetical protein
MPHNTPRVGSAPRMVKKSVENNDTSFYNVPLSERKDRRNIKDKNITARQCLYTEWMAEILPKEKFRAKSMRRKQDDTSHRTD